MSSEGNVSGSQILHGLLMDQEEGFQFTGRDITNLSKKEGYDFGLGLITGFINRALIKGVIEVVGRTGNIHHYRLIDKTVEWKFKPPSLGGVRGRNILGRIGRDIQEDIPDLETTESSIPLSEQLMNLATTIERMETKSLKDYSTEELIEEIKSRMK